MVTDPKGLSASGSVTVAMKIRKHWSSAAVYILLGILIYTVLKWAMNYRLKNAQYLRAAHAYKALEIYIANIIGAPDYVDDPVVTKFGEQLLAYLHNRTRYNIFYLAEEKPVNYKALPELYAAWYEVYEECANVGSSGDINNAKKELKAISRLLPQQPYTKENIDTFNKTISTTQQVIDKQKVTDKAAKARASSIIDGQPNGFVDDEKPAAKRPNVQDVIAKLEAKRFWASFAQFLLITTIAVTSGLIVLWVDNYSWGVTKDIFVAITWGAGLNLLKEANVSKLNGAGDVNTQVMKVINS